ncbi:MAG: substrate-binding domain-containing protein, partial [Acetobacteraceae bacterium]|nr:substrate-binding domain-containing protein [Acetobacteraceae bacterium]
MLLHAAGSLRTALDQIAAAYETATATHVVAKYGASGTLREEIETGTRAEVFASANMEHPLALSRAGKSGPVVLFARNQLCALVRGGLALEPASLLDRMMAGDLKLGTSTPKADPSGDCAWEVFRKADAIRPGAFATLSHRGAAVHRRAHEHHGMERPRSLRHAGCARTRRSVSHLLHQRARAGARKCRPAHGRPAPATWRSVPHP